MGAAVCAQECCTYYAAAGSSSRSMEWLWCSSCGAASSAGLFMVQSVAGCGDCTMWHVIHQGFAAPSKQQGCLPRHVVYQEALLVLISHCTVANSPFRLQELQ
jgi:hypothetical protein